MYIIGKLCLHGLSWIFFLSFIEQASATDVTLSAGDNTMDKKITTTGRLVQPQLRSASSPSDTQDNKCPILTVGTFFEYMKTAYQMKDNFEGIANVLKATSKIDWMNFAQVHVNVNVQSQKDDFTNSGTGVGDASNEGTILDCGDGERNGSSDWKIPAQGVGARHGCESMSYSHTDGTSNESPSAGYQYTTVSDFFSDTERIIRPLGVNNAAHGETECIDSSEASRTRIWHKGLPIMEYENGNNTKEGALREVLRNCASDILHEGLLDSVLPYVLPKPVLSQPAMRKAAANANTVKGLPLSRPTEDELGASSLSAEDASEDKAKMTVKSAENEVEIHVCDEAKNTKKDFRCPQKLLVQNMRYFADVTAGQKLEEIDISVHCDVFIFDWLMKWVKKDSSTKSGWPVLEAGSVIPIMVSASFLQMEPLLDYCAQYCYENMSDILKTSTVLTRLNDDLLTRLAALFSNMDVEALKDKKDKIQSRLFCKLIVSLSNTTPDCKKGHYGSLSSLFKCGKCRKTMVRPISESVPCIPEAMRIDGEGNVCSKHTRDPTWTLNDYIHTLRTELRTWRKVYWKLWGDCHFFFCRECEVHFPLTQMNWCCHHPETPQFFSNEKQKATFSPLGRYPCCGERAYKFQALHSQGGCKYKEHTPDVGNDQDVDTLNIFNACKEAISIDPPQMCFLERVTRLVAHEPNLGSNKLTCKETMWWNGLVLASPRLKFGLLGRIWGDAVNRRCARSSDSQKSLLKVRRQNSAVTDASADSSPETDTDEDIADTEDNGNSTTEDSYQSEESCARSSFPSLSKRERKQTCRGARRLETSGRWFANLPIRQNQDNQRDFEEKAAAQMVMLLSLRAPTDSAVFLKMSSKQSSPPSKNSPCTVGGSYVKVEADFRDQWMHACKLKGPFNGKPTVHLKPNKPCV